MTISKRIASIGVAAVLGIAGLTAVTLAAGHGGHWGHSAWAEPGGKPGSKPMCRRGGHGKPDRHGGPQRHDGPDLAERLSIIETKIGIRANQLDAWRDFTDSLQATMKRPMRPGGPGMMAPGAAEPFSLAEGIADRAIDRGESAEDLKKAIAELRTTLTPEQLETVQEIEAKLRAKMAQHHGWSKGPRGHHGKGPHGRGPHGKGPHGPPAKAAPADAGDTASDDTDDEDGDE